MLDGEKVKSLENVIVVMIRYETVNNKKTLIEN
jgi:hypothetical protein